MSMVVIQGQDAGTTLQVRIATTTAQLEQVQRLRKRIYVDELQILQPDHAYVQGERLVDPYDDWSTHLACFAGDVPVGTIRVTETADGALELEEYLDLNACDEPTDELAELTRYMVTRAWRRTQVGPLLIFAAWKLLDSRSERRVMLIAAKVGNLGRHYKNGGLEHTGLPSFCYGLTGCTYELLKADFGAGTSWRRRGWRVRNRIYLHHPVETALLIFSATLLADAAFFARLSDDPADKEHPLVHHLPMVHVAAMIVLLPWAASFVADASQPWMQRFGLLIAFGVHSCTFSINVAHELVHRRGYVQRLGGGLLSAMACYGTFPVEHVRGHPCGQVAPTRP
jgi:hypothetical protein